ncbi:aldo/keto reductase [Jiangella asiatica]|uniref:Aldo/keto reductase n=1 Tax=Jiangella asiatica TaxID=2530372 RepID=A0A4R5DPR3_9ACTN|nr:aldo/keto reductase [Jiangella asiatica]TDE14194.1 aldo/keto reductase [Jiangella asiatica]
MKLERIQLPGTRLSVSRLVQGTMAIDTLAEPAAHALLDGVLDLGCTTFDTAHVYGAGLNERVFGRWVRRRGVRDEVVIIGKGGEPGPDGPRVTPEHIASDLHESLERMGIDHIDLYLLHVDDPAIPVDPIVDALAGHQADGLIAAYGVSNWHHDRIAAALAYAKAVGLPPLVASSVHLSLATWQERPWPGNLSIAGPEHAADRAWYRRTGLPVLSWSSLAGGFFSGRISRRNRHELTEYFDQVCARAYGHERNFARLDRARELGARHGVSAAQVALAWVLAQPLPVAALVGSLDIAEFRANAAAVTLSLSDDELRWLENGTA